MKSSCIMAMAGILVIVSIGGLGTQQAKGADQVLRIKNLMTPSEFKLCGLEKLSRKELARLDSWLRLYTLRVVQALAGDSSPDVIESRIEGEFEGWDGDTIFKLENGQIWQQSSYAYTYHYAYRPEVLIYKTNGRYKMKVEGIDETIYVERIK